MGIKKYVVHEQWVEDDDGLVFVGIDDAARMLRLPIEQLMLYKKDVRMPKLPHAYPNLGYIEFYEKARWQNRFVMNAKDDKYLKRIGKRK